MRCLIRTIIRRGKAEPVYRDAEVEAEILNIGRATDQDVFLSDMRVALKHATIAPAGKRRYQLHAASMAGVRVNGLMTQTAFVQPGDSIGIGHSELRIVEPPKGYDLVIEIEQKSTKDFAAAYRAKAKLDLTATRWRKRSWSWTFFLFVLLIFLVAPMAHVFYAECGADQARGAGGRCEPMAKAALPADLPLPDDKLWLSGDLAAAHHFFGNECRTCHQEPFISVRDQACAGCHANTPAHTDPEFQNLAALRETRCATCHKEHNGQHALIRFDAGLCADCHEDLQQTISAELNAKTDLLNASDFGSDHPEFRATLVSVDYNGLKTQQRVSLSDHQRLREHSNLKFPHDKHLKKKLKSPDGEVQLHCESCHVPEPGGARMQPIDMETMCQDCHRLAFEPKDPQRQVPHGKVKEVLFTLQEYYGLKALAGGYEDESAPPVVRQRRRPGVRLTETERQEAMDWACKKTAQVSTEVFKARLCGSCHQVRQLEPNPDQPCLPQWDVLPARVTEVWFPKAHFTHEKHKTMDCGECHQAQTSSSSEDVLIPGIANCRQCHGGADATDKLQSTCVDCHGFHVSKYLMMDRSLSNMANKDNSNGE